MKDGRYIPENFVELAKRERASANHAACPMWCINTSYEGRAIHHAYRYAELGDMYTLSVYPLHQRVTTRIIRDLHLLLPVASANATAATELKYLDSMLVANIHRNIIRLQPVAVLNHRDKSKSRAPPELSRALSSYNIDLRVFLCFKHVACCRVSCNVSFQKVFFRRSRYCFREFKNLYTVEFVLHKFCDTNFFFNSQN